MILIAYFALQAVITVVGLSVIGLDLTNSVSFEHITVKEALVWQLLTLFVTIIIVYVFRKFIDIQSISSLGFSLKNIFSDTLKGIFTASFILFGGTWVLVLLGNIEFIKIDFSVYELLFSFFVYVLVAFNEELLFRAYILNNLLDSMNNKVLPIVISSGLFALLHISNFNTSIISIFNIFLAGILLGLVYIITKNIWFSFSLHIFWNFIQGSILGYAVSGSNIYTMTTQITKGDNSVSGGEFGFEGSIVCTAFTIFAIIYFLVSPKFRKLL